MIIIVFLAFLVGVLVGQLIYQDVTLEGDA